MRIVLVIFISTHDSLSSPLNHSAVVTSVIIRALTQETICQIQNSSWKSSLTTLWNNIHHNYGVNSYPRWQRKKPVTRSITQVLLKVPVDLWSVITVHCGFHRSIAKTWWETSIITPCRPSLRAERVANSADGPHLIEFSSTVNSEAALRFNPLFFRAKVRQHKTLSHVSFYVSSLKTPPVSMSTCPVQQSTLHSPDCLAFFFFFYPSGTRARLVNCQCSHFAKCWNEVWGAWCFPRRVFMKHHTGGLGTVGSLSPCRLLQYDKASVSVICKWFAYSTMMVYSGGSLRGKYTTSEMDLFIYATNRFNQLFNPNSSLKFINLIMIIIIQQISIVVALLMARDYTS